jgi:hypothetical protein
LDVLGLDHPSYLGEQCAQESSEFLCEEFDSGDDLILEIGHEKVLIDFNLFVADNRVPALKIS